MASASWAEFSLRAVGSYNKNSTIVYLAIPQCIDCLVDARFRHGELFYRWSDLVSHAEVEHIFVLGAIAHLDTENVNALEDGCGQRHKRGFEVDSERYDIAAHGHERHISRGGSAVIVLGEKVR